MADKIPNSLANNMPNEDKNDTSLSVSSEDAAANSTLDVGNPNKADVDSALDADNPNEAGTGSASNSTPNSMSNSAPDSTPESTSDNIPDADSPSPQHPHRKRNIAIGVIIAVVVVAAIAIILAFAHPWDAADNNDTASDESNSSSNESSLQIDEPDGISGEDNATEHPDNANGYDEPGDTGDSNASDNNNIGDSSSQSEPSKDTTADPEDTTAESGDIPTIPSEWITGPQTFDSEEDAERFEAGEWHTDKSLRSRYGFKEVKTDDGTTYVAGELNVYVPLKTIDEEVARIAETLGGQLGEIKDSQFSSNRRVTIIFPDNADIEKLSEIASDFVEVESAGNNGIMEMADAQTSDIVDLSFTNDPLASSQGYLSQSRFTDEKPLLVSFSN